MADAGPQAVAEEITDEPGFIIDDLNGALGTIGDAESAAVAQLLVDPYDLSLGHDFPPSRTNPAMVVFLSSEKT